MLSTALAYVLFFQILKRAGALNAMLVTLLVPVTATALGVAILGEALKLGDFIGASLIGLALLLIDGRIFGLFPATRPA